MSGKVEIKPCKPETRGTTKYYFVVSHPDWDEDMESSGYYETMTDARVAGQEQLDRYNKNGWL